MWAIFDIDWVGVALALAYLLVISGSWVALYNLYDKWKASKIASQASWFGPHLQRNVYLSLQHMRSEDGKIPESVLRAALLRRATENIDRINKIRNAKTACSSLLQRGSVGEELFHRLQQTEKEMEEEIRDTIMEANALVPQWGNFIFQSASEIAANAVFRNRIGEIQAQVDAEKEWWAKRQTSEQSRARKEQDEDSEKTQVKVSTDDEPMLVDENSPLAMQLKKRKKNKGKP